MEAAPFMNLGQDRLAIRVGLVVILALIVARLTLPRLNAWSSREYAAAETARLRLLLARQAIRRGNEVVKSLADIRASHASLQSLLLEGPEGLAPAILARRIGEAAESAGADLEVLQPLASVRRTGAFRIVRARATARGSLEAIMDLLTTIETGPERLQVRELHLNQPDVAVAPSRMESLTAEFEVAAIVSRETLGRRDP
jgi:hypothetical protein